MFDPNLFTKEKLVGLFKDNLLIYRGPLQDSPLEVWSELLVDIISLANLSRARGKNSYLLFGVRIIDEEIIVNDAYIGDRSFQDVYQIFRSYIDEFIDPNPAISLHTGQVLGERYSQKPLGLEPYIHEVDVFYFEISHIATSKPFVLNNVTIVKELSQFHEGECWLRRNLINEKIPGSEQIWLENFETSTFLENHEWKHYLQSIKAVRTDDKSHDLSRFGLHESFSREIQLRDVEGNPLAEIVDDFLVDDTNKLFVITGETGLGKTYFLKKVAFDYAETAYKLFDKDSTLHYPPTWIPLYQPLTGYEESGKFLELLNTNLLSHFPKETLHGVVTNRDYPILIFLDGLNEIELSGYGNNWRATIDAIWDFVTTTSNIKLLISSHESMVPRAWQSRSLMVSISPLSNQQIVTELKKYPVNRLVLNAATTLLFRNQELVELVRRPLFFHALVDYLLEVEIDEQKDELDLNQMSLGEILDILISTLLNHDELKDRKPNYARFKAERLRAIEEFAAFLDGSFEETTWSQAKNYLDDDSRSWSLDLGIIKQRKHKHRRTEAVGFQSSLLKRYFATHYLWRLSREDEWNKISDLPNRDFWWSCIEEFQKLLAYPVDIYSELAKQLKPVRDARTVVEEYFEEKKNTENDLRLLVRALYESFSKRELQALAFELLLDEDDLPLRKQELAREVVLILFRRHRIPDLINHARRVNPLPIWNEFKQIFPMDESGGGKK